MGRLRLLAPLLVAARCAAQQELALPSAKQLDFQVNKPIGCFFHFGMNTFAGTSTFSMERYAPSHFTAPADLSTDQWLEACVALGGKYAVFTAKHEDGFFNWPSNLTNFTVANTPFCAARRAAGRSCDLVREFLASCDKFNVTRALYFTSFNAWSKTPEAAGVNSSAMLRAAFSELANNYGHVDQWWFDHGDQFVLDLVPPNSLVLGRDWGLVGTEGGYVKLGRDTLWYPQRSPARFHVGPAAHSSRMSAATTLGAPRGSAGWMGYQCDTTLSTMNWFWRSGEVPRKTVLEGINVYVHQCLGFGAGLVLNMPPDTRGVVQPSFVRWAGDFRRELDRRYGHPLGSANGTVDTHAGAGLELKFTAAMGHRVDSVRIREDLRFGQRIAAWVLQIAVGQPDGQITLQTVGAGSTIGARRIYPLLYGGPQANVYGVRFVPTLSVAADGLVHVAELSAFNSAGAAPPAKMPAVNATGAGCFPF